MSCLKRYGKRTFLMRCLANKSEDDHENMRAALNGAWNIIQVALHLAANYCLISDSLVNHRSTSFTQINSIWYDHWRPLKGGEPTPTKTHRLGAICQAHSMGGTDFPGLQSFQEAIAISRITGDKGYWL